MGGRHRRLTLGDQLFLPEQPLDLPEAETEPQQHHRHGEHGRPEQRAKPGHPGAERTQVLRRQRGAESWWRYCSAINPAFSGRSIATAPIRINGVHSSRCTQIGGENLISTNAASPTTIIPRKKITKTAGPSPASCADRSRPHTSHAWRTLNRPVNSRPLPQRGHRQPSAARSGEMTGKSRWLAHRSRHQPAGPAPPLPSPHQ